MNYSEITRPLLTILSFTCYSFPEGLCPPASHYIAPGAGSYAEYEGPKPTKGSWNRGRMRDLVEEEAVWLAAALGCCPRRN